MNKLQEEIEKELSLTNPDVSKLEDFIYLLQEENAKLKSVLKFVADEENFNENFYSYGYGSRSDYLKESGNRARELLKKLEDGKS